jgi:hypothetical protein
MALVKIPVKSLDELSNRINTICDDYVRDIKAAHGDYVAACEELSQRTDASPDLDQNAVASIVLGRIKKMIADAGEAIS